MKKTFNTITNLGLSAIPFIALWIQPILTGDVRAFMTIYVATIAFMCFTLLILGAQMLPAFCTCLFQLSVMSFNVLGNATLDTSIIFLNNLSEIAGKISEKLESIQNR